MIHNGIEYYTFDELFPIAQAALRNKILNSEYKFLGDINKTFNNKTDTGKWLKQNGYIKQRILVNGKRSNYYYKAEIKSQMQTSENSEINPL